VRRLLIFLSVVSLLLLGMASLRVAQAKDGYAGAETCAACHEDRYESFSKSYHGIKADPRTPAAKMECETCHGPGASHAEAGGGRGVGEVVSLSPTSGTPAEKINATCLQCHSKLTKMTMMWKGSKHQRNGLACSNCHNIHAGNLKDLAKPTQIEVCTQCHRRIRAEIQKSSHHPIREGRIKCSDCHNPHGTNTDKLISAGHVNEKCYQCHPEKRGPFLWEHAPVREDCTNCHTPHGSNNPGLLVTKGSFLCLRCHSYGGHVNLPRYNRATASYGQGCINCHNRIHGSMSPSGAKLYR